VPKGTYTDLAQAQAQLVDKKLIYQLTTPTEHTLDRPLNLPIYRNGTIIQEPTSLNGKLSYSYPTNLGKSIESIVDNLTWVKDTQDFLLAYMLDLETRLSLIEGGMM